ncbi:MAG: hypothetical protein RLZZ502_1556 [Pseudomonadota bacterium]|jgi:uncharacterized protein (DUF934 family)
MPQLINRTQVLAASPTELTLAPGDSLGAKPATLPKSIAIDFPMSPSGAADGRGYTLAHQLRRDWAYTGTLRATGVIGLDHLHYLARVGFDEFELPDTLDAQKALHYFDTFKEPYQASTDKARSLLLDKLLR